MCGRWGGGGGGEVKRGRGKQSCACAVWVLGVVNPQLPSCVLPTHSSHPPPPPTHLHGWGVGGVYVQGHAAAAPARRLRFGACKQGASDAAAARCWGDSQVGEISNAIPSHLPVSKRGVGGGGEVAHGGGGATRGLGGGGAKWGEGNRGARAPPPAPCTLAHTHTHLMSPLGMSLRLSGRKSAIVSTTTAPSTPAGAAAASAVAAEAAAAASAALPPLLLRAGLGWTMGGSPMSDARGRSRSGSGPPGAKAAIGAPATSSTLTLVLLPLLLRALVLLLLASLLAQAATRQE